MKVLFLIIINILLIWYALERKKSLPIYLATNYDSTYVTLKSVQNIDTSYVDSCRVDTCQVYVCETILIKPNLVTKDSLYVKKSVIKEKIKIKKFIKDSVIKDVNPVTIQKEKHFLFNDNMLLDTTNVLIQ